MTYRAQITRTAAADVADPATILGPQTVAVLGGTGFIGSAIARRLAVELDTVVVGRSVPHPHQQQRPGEPRFQRADLSDQESVDAVLDGVDAAVYSVGAMLPAESVASPLADVLHTLTPLLHVLEHARKHPELRLVFLSSGGAIYGNPTAMPVLESHSTDPISSYGVLKLTAEKYIQMYSHLYGVDARILRVANAYGPRQPLGRSQGVVGGFVDAALRDEPLRIFGTGRSVRDYIHVDDIALAVQAAVLTDGPEVVNVATGVGTSLLQLVDMLQELLDRPLHVDLQPGRAFDVDAVVLDASAFKAMVGSEPIPFADGLRGVVDVARADMAGLGVR